ncbi:MAG TPA: response regulator [Verrucomicrobiae bacterium]|jgi:CheY-like chemotaxis protein|nr:response regulator [Verrucomicrobiae bacterium]
MSITPSDIPFDDHRPPRILIIDDNPSIHRDFELVFLDESENAALDADDQRIYGAPAPVAAQKGAYILEHAHSGLEGIARVTQDKAAHRYFQMAFVDIRMPGMDGLETIERIWRIDPKIQVVICTAYADYSQEDLTDRLGHTDKLLLLKKPFDSIEVTQLARTLTEKWYLARQAALKLEQMELLVSQRTQRLMELQADAAAPAAPRDQDQPEERLPVILLVAGSADLTRQVCAALEKDHQTTAVADPAAALERARELVPDLILIDVALSGLEGLALCRSLKADLVTSHIPVIVLSAAETADYQLPALDAGADDYLPHALNPATLKARVATLLESRRQLRSRFHEGAALQPRELALNPTDARFLQRTIAVVEQNLSDFEFDVDALARSVAVSRRQLFRKLKALIDTTPKALIRSVRLKRAAQLLAESRMTVTEITFAVGFLDVKHFRALFKDEFGVLPSEYIKPEASDPS